MGKWGATALSGLSLLVSLQGYATECPRAGQFQQAIREAITAPRRLERAAYALTVFDARSGERICGESLNGTQNVYPASSIKTLIAVAILRRVDLGDVNLTDYHVIDEDNAEAECGGRGCNTYYRGNRVTIAKMMHDMITISSNLATNELIDIAGKDFINETADLLEAPSLRVFRKVYNRVNPEPEILERNRASALGLTALYREIATGRLMLLSEESRAHLRWLLGQQQHNNRFNADWPSDVRFFHKTGATSDSSSDAGFFMVDADTVAVIAGLQDFRDYRPFKRIGLVTLQMLGRIRR